MQRTCSRCSKTIAGLAKSYVECGRLFHPGCVKAYLGTKSAGGCCRVQLSAMPLTPREAHGSQPVDHRSPAMQSAVDGVPRGPLQSTEALLQSILTRIEEADTKSAARLNDLDKKFTAVFERSDKKISAFIDRQQAVNVDFAQKLDQIPNILKIVEGHGERIAVLEAQSARLLSSQHDDRGLSAASRVSGASEIIISGIPSSITDASGVLVESVFCALGVSHLVSDVLETRDVVGRDTSVVSAVASGSVSAGNIPSGTSGRKRSVIVAFKSREIRDHILKIMRSRRRLLVSDVFSVNVPGNVYVNELLPTHAYNLLRQTRIKARQTSFKHVWSRDGRIFVRKDHGQPPISIASEADLEQLH
ncbi:uncharacterized protein LOC112465889 [Temnothorax curvispinosus]|uniref:Uncharacterized protein LOC112465889 n=1 Tax=Temnothorax curvispinosus TaxID=300111 RepID=A0A6J1R5G9_9HYME|nr:uncharacterized protein LOC112465889 [Temnothorax curvispinosus]